MQRPGEGVSGNCSYVLGIAPPCYDSKTREEDVWMSEKNKNALLALTSMVAGIACMPVAAFFSTIAGLTLASLSIYLVYLAG